MIFKSGCEVIWQLREPDRRANTKPPTFEQAEQTRPDRTGQSTKKEAVSNKHGLLHYVRRDSAIPYQRRFLHHAAIRHCRCCRCRLREVNDTALGREEHACN